ncbi:type II toxin-antitoxin system RelE/ParE family toxin [Desulfococcaceae bacterium HSG9]|nr:type II toxin-antitoxin system RelE/ParE family toxin [Desulfococcaceae bacterium HSG9]
MRYELVIKPEAEEDLSETFEWYEEKRKGLGYDFLLQIDAGLRLIENNPLAFRERYKGTRRHIIKRFPYIIVYRVEDLKVIVLGVLYGGRDPRWIKKKINGTIS